MRIRDESETMVKMSDEEIGREITVGGLTRMAPEKRQTRPYVVRDLSWELARYLETESFSATTSATSNGVSG